MLCRQLFQEPVDALVLARLSDLVGIIHHHDALWAKLADNEIELRFDEIECVAAVEEYDRKIVDGSQNGGQRRDGIAEMQGDQVVDTRQPVVLARFLGIDRVRSQWCGRARRISRRAKHLPERWWSSPSSLRFL